MNNTLVGLNIKQSRKELKLTQKQLADMVGKTESSIRKYERGLIEVPNSVLEQIAAALNTNLSSLIGLEDNQNNTSRFYNLMESMGYIILRDDPEHRPFLKTPNGDVYSLEYGDLERFTEVSEAYIKYTIDTTLQDRKKIK